MHFRRVSIKSIAKWWQNVEKAPLPFTTKSSAYSHFLSTNTRPFSFYADGWLLACWDHILFGHFSTADIILASQFHTTSALLANRLKRILPGHGRTRNMCEENSIGRLWKSSPTLVLTRAIPVRVHKWKVLFSVIFLYARTPFSLLWLQALAVEVANFVTGCN